MLAGWGAETDEAETEVGEGGGRLTRVQRRRTLRGLFHFRKFKFKSGTRKCTRATRRWRTAAENHNKVCKMRNANARGRVTKMGKKRRGRGLYNGYTTSVQRNRRRVSIFVRSPVNPPRVSSRLRPPHPRSFVCFFLYIFFFRRARETAYLFLTGGRERASDFVRV